MMQKTEKTDIWFTDPVLLTKIDKLFACGVGDRIALPQLVVVGDQSSGKSSVLEGLTKLPFPRDNSLCTRFATQITFRRSTDSKVVVSVIPAQNASPEYKEELRQWGRVERDELTAENFASIMKEVHSVMKLSWAENDSPGKTFSEDVLRIEVNGPEQEHFSVVDVPGIFRKATPGQTTKEDIDAVRNMVVGYMRNHRSVLLAVVPANVDVATQDILTMAEEHDANGIRTIGVLTKPDLVDAGAEPAIIDLLEDRSHPLNLGWYVVKNTNQKDLSDLSFDRDASETEFFRTTAPWNSVDPKRMGIASLRSRLQNILAKHIRREFPAVKAEISNKLSTAQKQLSQLGSKRDTSDEQRQFLFSLCNQFQHFTTSALNAEYNSLDAFGEMNDLRLPTNVINRSMKFAEELEESGHTYDLGQESTHATLFTADDSPADTSLIENESKLFVRQYNAGTDSAISDIVIKNDHYVNRFARKDALRWLQGLHEDCRGFEMGTVNKNVLAVTMRMQTSKWELISLGYISDIIEMVHAFICKMLHVLCPNEDVRSSLLAKMTDELLARYQVAFDRVKFLLQVERAEIPATQDHYFNDSLQKRRQGRQSAGNMGKAEDVAQDLHDILASYYEVARKRFVDCVYHQAALHFLVKGSQDTPLRLFSSVWVSNLSTDDLEEIAGDEEGVKHKRLALKKTIENLEEGKDILTSKF